MSFLSGTLSQIWLSIQQSLFPWLQDELGELSEKEKQLVAIFELIRIESFISSTGVGRKGGRPEEDRGKIARGFVAKAVYNMGTTRETCMLNVRWRVYNEPGGTGGNRR